MRPKTIHFMLSVSFLIIILAACAKSSQTSDVIATPIVILTQTEVIVTPTILPQETVSEATSTVLPQEPEVVAMPTDGVWHLVVISESSGWGLGEAFADKIEKDLGVKVVLDDFAIGGNLTAVTVLQALETGESNFSRLSQLSDALKEANIVLMFANPMDSVDQETSNSINDCFASTPPTLLSPNAFEKYTTDLKAIWMKIFELRSGQPTILRAMDIANPFVNSWKKNQIFDACTAYFEGVSTAVRQAADAYHIPFLSRYDTFNGLKHDEDLGEKGYLIADGVHPNNKAIQLTVEMLSKMGYEPVPPP